jgi:CBS domain-containing protein
MEGSMATIYVSEIMTTEPICCKVSDPLADVIYRLALAEVNALPVVDEKNRTQGIISQNHILENYTSIESLKAGDVMNRDLVWIDAHASIEEAARLMVETNALRLIVHDPGQPEVSTGIVSASDIMRALAEEFRTPLPVKI